MSLIGLMCKRGDTFSLQVLIGRGLFLLFQILILFSLIISRSITVTLIKKRNLEKSLDKPFKIWYYN